MRFFCYDNYNIIEHNKKRTKTHKTKRQIELFKGIEFSRLSEVLRLRPKKPKPTGLESLESEDILVEF